MNEIKISDYIRTNYEDYYDEGDSAWRQITAIDKVDNIISLCKELPQRSILEIGAGEGSLLRRMSELHFGEKFYAVEISSSGVEVIKKKSIPRLADCRVFDGYHVPYDNDKFDIAILSHVIEHVEHPRQLLYEASRVAKYLFVEVPLEDTARLPNDFVFNKVGHINFYSPRTIRLLIQSCNLNILNQIIRNPSKDTYTFAYGRKGVIKYYIKQFMIAASPSFSAHFLSYCGALLCEKKVP